MRTGFDFTLADAVGAIRGMLRKDGREPMEVPAEEQVATSKQFVQTHPNTYLAEWLQRAKPSTLRRLQSSLKREAARDRDYKLFKSQMEKLQRA